MRASLKTNVTVRSMPCRTQPSLADGQIEANSSQNTTSPTSQALETKSALMHLDDHSFDLDTIINKLKKAIWSWPGTKVHLIEAQIWRLCTRAKDVFMSQPALLEIDAPINVSEFVFTLC